MKINYNGHIPRKIKLDDIMASQAFEFDNYYYMKIIIACAGLDVKYRSESQRSVVNLHSGTVRMLEKDILVWPLQSKVQLRQPSHTHEELNGSDTEDRPLG